MLGDTGVSLSTVAECIKEELERMFNVGFAAGAKEERERIALFVEESQEGDSRRQARYATAMNIAAAIRSLE